MGSFQVEFLGKTIYNFTSGDIMFRFCGRNKMENASMFISRFVLVVSLMLTVSSIAFGQPLFHSEHEWTIRLDYRKFGIDRRIQEPGHWQQTQFFLGGSPYHPEKNYENRVVFLLPGIKELYVAHTISRFVVESYLADDRASSVAPNRWILLSRRLALPYLQGSPRIFDYPQTVG